MKRTLGQKIKRFDIVKNSGAYVLLLPAIVLCIIFSYLPMVGIIIAFQNYDPMSGILGSSFVGLENFIFFFRGSEWVGVIVNTLFLNTAFIITGTIAAVVLAVILSEIAQKTFLKVSQTIMTLPHFVSWSTVALFAVAFFSIDGAINNIGGVFGMSPISFYSTPGVWPLTFIIIRIWKGAGWSSIIFMAAILGIDRELYESARIDGAGRVKCIFLITLPLLTNTIVLLTILSIGNIFRGDFGMIFPFIGDNAMLFPTTDVIDTFVFRALRQFTNIGRTAAIGLFQSIMGFLMVLVSNFLARRYSPEAAIF